jgi:hypothetical protein
MTNEETRQYKRHNLFYLKWDFGLLEYHIDQKLEMKYRGYKYPSKQILDNLNA